MDDLQEQIRAAEADLEAAVQRLQELRAQIPKPPPVCKTCGRPAIWEDYHHGDYKERYCAEHYHEFVKFPDGDLSEWAAAVAGEALVASKARVAELEAERDAAVLRANTEAFWRKRYEVSLSEEVRACRVVEPRPSPEYVRLLEECVSCDSGDLRYVGLPNACVEAECEHSASRPATCLRALAAEREKEGN